MDRLSEASGKSNKKPGRTGFFYFYAYAIITLQHISF